jgi:hypothetical protein
LPVLLFVIPEGNLLLPLLLSVLIPPASLSVLDRCFYRP